MKNIFWFLMIGICLLGILLLTTLGGFGLGGCASTFREVITTTTTTITTSTSVTTTIIPFTDRSWQTAGQVEGHNVYAHSPQIKMDKNGRAFAIWHETVSSATDLWASISAPGGGWGTPEKIAAGISSSLLAVSRSGAVVLWNQSSDPANVAHSSSYSTGSGWGTPETVGIGIGTIAMNDNGDAVAVSGNQAIHFSFGSGWGAVEDIGANIIVNSAAIDAGGNALVVGVDGSKEQNVFSKRYIAGTGWTNYELIDNSPYVAGLYPMIAMSQNGDAVAVWLQKNEFMSTEVYANNFTSGVWGTAERIDSSADWANDQQCAIDGSGNAIAVWKQAGRIWANRYTPSGWGTPRIIDGITDALQYANPPQIALDDGGNAVVVWRQWEGSGSYNIWANTYTAGSGWGTAQLIENEGGDADNPQVAISLSRAIAVWQQEEVSLLGSSKIRFNIF